MLTTLGVQLDGARVVDLGTGTGTLARGMARRGALVTGIDPSSVMTEEAERLDLEWGITTRYITGKAEKTGLESDGYDVVTSGQSWWWFDRHAALAETRRILKPEGTLAICSFDWVPRPGNVVELTEKLIEKHNPEWSIGGGNGQHPDFITDLESGGFEAVRSDYCAVDAMYTKEAWRGRIRASAGVGATLTPEQVETFDKEHAALLNAFTGDDPIAVPHGIFLAVGRNPA